MKVFAIDLSVCNGCYCCQIACKDEHVANDWTPYAKPQPDTGQFWLGLTELVRGQVPKVKVTYIPHLCQHCDEAPCMDDCKPGAIIKREDGLVLIDPDKCTGCKLCVDTCPHDAIFMNENLNIAQKCTGCAHLLDNDPDWDVPRCVDQCPTEALRFGEESDFADFIAEAELLNPGAGTKSRVYYKHLPKKFVAGTVYDPVEKEVIIGAACTLKDTDSGERFSATTDNFGDFWFRGLADNRTFRLSIEKDGKTHTVDAVSTDKDLCLGDIPMNL
ncbi:MAG: 4Fe-4S binding protein, partial [Desulfosarcina sp.]|nr:4Fe-4S binding protein [Desulfobacterales bacterium]